MVLSRLNQVVTLIFLRNHVCSLFKYWCFCSPTVPCQWHWALSLFGHVNKNKRHFVLITRLSDIHGTDRCETLLGLHYSDFCRYSSTVLCEKGHQCWKKNLKKFPWFQHICLSRKKKLKKDIHENLSFVHCLYGRLWQICKDFKLTEMDQRVYQSHWIERPESSLAIKTFLRLTTEKDYHRP